MFRAYTLGVDVSSTYRKTYRHYSMNKEYRKIIARTARSARTLKKYSALPNELLMADGKLK
jgi:hypothetical protein